MRSQPPYVRVVRPRFKKHTGYVISGALCMELLTPSEWSPATSVNALVMSVRAMLLVGEARAHGLLHLKQLAEARGRRQGRMAVALAGVHTFGTGCHGLLLLNYDLVRDTGAQLIDIDTALETCGILIVLVDHDLFRSIPAEERRHMTVYDTRGIWPAPHSEHCNSIDRTEPMGHRVQLD